MKFGAWDECEKRNVIRKKKRYGYKFHQNLDLGLRVRYKIYCEVYSHIGFKGNIVAYMSNKNVAVYSLEEMGGSLIHTYHLTHTTFLIKSFGKAILR
jgi:hypothetical protein